MTFKNSPDINSSFRRCPRNQSGTQGMGPLSGENYPEDPPRIRPLGFVRLFPEQTL